MAVEFILDASEWEPPRPFEEACEILQKLRPGEYLRMLHRRIPYPLFDFCRALSLQHQVIEGGSPAYQIIIYFPVDEPDLRRAGLL